MAARVVLATRGVPRSFSSSGSVPGCQLPKPVLVEMLYMRLFRVLSTISDRLHNDVLVIAADYLCHPCKGFLMSIE